jgi:hypothetical protein
MRTALLACLMPLSLSAQVDERVQLPDPCALPEGVTFDLTGDHIADVTVFGYADGQLEIDPPEGGVCRRAVNMMPGTDLLYAIRDDAYWDVFVPRADEPLTPERLAAGLSAGRMRWGPGGANVLYWGYTSIAQRTLGWCYEEPRTWERLVFRTAVKDGYVIGLLEISTERSQGKVSVRSASVVAEGRTLTF